MVKGTKSYTSGTVSTFASEYEPSPYSTGWFLDSEFTKIATENYLSITNESSVTLYCKTASITGLTFKLSSDGNSYLVGGTSSLSGEVVIKYNGKSISGVSVYGFQASRDLTYVFLPNTCKSLEQSAFSGCISLTDIKIPNSVTSIGEWAFQGCGKLMKIYIPSSVITIKGSSDYYSPFRTCDHNMEIYCEASSKPSGWGTYWYYAREGEGEFYQPSVTWGASALDIYGFTFTLNSDANSYSVEKIAAAGGVVIIPETYNGKPVTIIGDNAAAARDITSVIIPNSVTSIGKFAFQSCRCLTNITIPDSVTSIGANAFKSCYVLSKIYIPESVTTISCSSATKTAPFYECSSSLKIYCGANSKPSSWLWTWNYCGPSETLSVYA